MTKCFDNDISKIYGVLCFIYILAMLSKLIFVSRFIGQLQNSSRGSSSFISIIKGRQKNVRGNGTYVNTSEIYSCLSLCCFMTCTPSNFQLYITLAIKQWLIPHIHLLSDVYAGFQLHLSSTIILLYIHWSHTQKSGTRTYRYYCTYKPIKLI